MTITIYKNDIPSDFKIDGDLAVDTEAMGLDIHRDRLCVLQFSNGDGNAYLVVFDGEDYSAPNLVKLLSDDNRQKIFHYARFDMAIIKYYLCVEFENVFCTKIASKLARTYSQSHGLKELCRELAGVNLSKQQQSSDWGNEELTIEQQEYAARDVLYLHQIRDKLVKMLEREGREYLAYELFAFLNTRIDLDIFGFGDDNKPDIFSYSS